MGQLIPFGNNNACVFGRTRSGKTYGAIHTLDRMKQGVFFYNVQHSPVPGRWVDVDAADDFDDVKELLERGEKINYMPDTRRNVADAEFAAIVDELYDGVERDIYIVPDEVQLYRKRADDALMRLATTCLRFQMKTIFISQRPAEMNYTLMTQSTLYAIYALSPFENEYFRKKGFPIDEMTKKLNDGGQYSYVLLDTASDKALTGPFKV